MPLKEGEMEQQQRKCCPLALVHFCTDSWKSKANAIVLIIMIILRWHFCGREIEALQSPLHVFLARYVQPLCIVFKATKSFQQMHLSPLIIFIHFICSYGSVGKISKFLSSYQEYLHPWSEIRLCHSGKFLSSCTWKLSHNSIHSGIYANTDFFSPIVGRTPHELVLTTFKEAEGFTEYYCPLLLDVCFLLYDMINDDMQLIFALLTV